MIIDLTDIKILEIHFSLTDEKFIWAITLSTNVQLMLSKPFSKSMLKSTNLVFLFFAQYTILLIYFHE